MARIRPATRIKAPRFSLAGTAALNERDVNARGDGALSPLAASLSGYGQRTTTTEEEYQSAFTEIPEIVFVRNIPESDDLAPFVLDTGNRIWPGDLAWRDGGFIQRHPHHPSGAGDWTARQPVTVSGTLPDGVTWDATHCRLVYNPAGHSTAKSNVSETFTVRLSLSGIESAPFNIRILVPTIVYGVDATTINSTMGWGVSSTKIVDRDYATLNNWDKAHRLQTASATYTTPNVTFVTPGTYATADGEDFYFQAASGATSSYNTYYFLSDPRNRAHLNAYGGGSTVFRMTQQFAELFYIKNFQTTAVTFPTQRAFDLGLEPTYGKKPYKKYLTKIDQRDLYTNNDGITTALAEGDDGYGPSYYGTVCHIWNMRQTNLGGSGNTYHSMYIEGRPGTRVRINNLFIDGTRLCSAIQSTVMDLAVHNSRLYVVPGADPSYAGYRCTDLLDIHSCDDAVIYNNWMVTGASREIGTTSYRGCLSGPIFLESRRQLYGGNDVPPYPEATWQRIPDDGPAFVPWSTKIKNTGLSTTYGALGTGQYGPTQNGPWTSLERAAIFIGSSTLRDWQLHVMPGEIPNGLHYIRIVRADGAVSTNPKQLRVYQSDTELLATTTWNYNVGTVAGFDMDKVETYINPYFWSAVAEKPVSDMTHPLRWKHFYSYNVVEWLDFTGEEQLSTVLTRVKGTQPVVAPWQFAAQTIIKRAPTGFVERSTGFWCNNRLINASKAGAALFDTVDAANPLQGTTATNPGTGETFQLWEPGNLWSPADIVEMGGNPANYPLAVGPGVPDRPYFDLGGNNFANPAVVSPEVPLPAGFRISTPQALGTTTAPTPLATVALTTASGSFSQDIDVPTLNTRTPRLDPYNTVGSDFPSNVGGTTTNGTDGRPATETRAWIWGSRFVWDSVRKMALGIYSPHLWDTPPMGPEDGKWQNQYNTLLGAYSETDNVFRVYEAPLNYKDPMSGFASHLFDNNCLVGRTLYKVTSPVYTTLNDWKWVQPQVVGIDVDAITPNLSSVTNGAAVVSDIGKPTDGDGNNITACAMDYHAGLNKIILGHKNRLWFYDFATGLWSNETIIPHFTGSVVGGRTVHAYHNMGHYNPTSQWFVYGGGAAAFDPDDDQLTNNDVYVRNFKWAGINPAGAVVALDDSPVCMSVSQGDGEPVTAKCAATYLPGSTESLFFHDNGKVYGLDPTRAPGTQWRTVATGSPAVEWVCAIPEYRCILLASYGGYTVPNQMNNRMFIYKA